METTNKNSLERLNNLASRKKEPRTIIGLMSGTSLDGLDIALIKFWNTGLDTKLEFRNFHTVPYTKEDQEKINKVLSKREVDLQQLTCLHSWLGTLHGKMVNSALKKWNVEAEEVDIIASSGQTIYHAPKSTHPDDEFGNATLQIGDGDHVAVTTGIITISDFRQKHVAAGGEGAPLAIYGDFLLFSDTTENRIMLNIGGISSLSWLPKSCNPSEVYATDMGPGNTLLDIYASKLFGKSIDENGQLACKGQCNEALLRKFLDHPLFKTPFPRTTGREDFNEEFVNTGISKMGAGFEISNYDLLATLGTLTVESIVLGLLEFSDKGPIKIYASGGGVHNTFLMTLLRKRLADFDHMQIHEFHVLGIPGDAKEATLFALLANECFAGQQNQTKFNLSLKVPSVSLGKISLPS